MKILPDAEMLDNLEEIKKIDKSGMLKVSLNASELAVKAIRLAEKIEFPKSYLNPVSIAVLGMGGSSIGGELLKDWLSDKISIPINICNDYWLPSHINGKSLVFAISYSGETEETLTAFIEAYKRKCRLFAITSGGHLKTFCEKLGIPYLLIPKGYAPRAALPYMFFPLAISIEKLGLFSRIKNELEETIQVMREISEENHVKKSFEQNLAKKLASELYGTIPIIYGFRQYASVAHRWKTQINENSKLICNYDVFPELNHNEAVGWETPRSLAKKFSIVLLRDPEEPPEIRERIEITKKIAFKKAGKLLEVKARGNSKLARMFSLLQLGDLVSVYLAILQRKDPTPVKTIDKVKKELKKRLRMVEKLERQVEKLL